MAPPLASRTAPVMMVPAWTPVGALAAGCPELAGPIRSVTRTPAAIRLMIDQSCHFFGSAKAIYPCGPVGVSGAPPVPPPSAPPTLPGPAGGDMNTTYWRPWDSNIVGMPIDCPAVLPFHRTL